MKVKAHIDIEGFTGRKKLFVTIEVGRDLFLLRRDQKTGEIVQEKLAEPGRVVGDSDALLILPLHLADEVFPAIVDALEKKGFERPSESMLRGENGALKAHLQDLRAILIKRGQL
jgi:hypothetical protein